MSLYQVLEIKPNVTLQEIKKSYRRLAKLYHPDKNNDIDTTEKFRKINYAYEILSDDKSRKKYNAMNNLDQTKFEKFLNKIFLNKLRINELDAFGISLSKSDFKHLEDNFSEMFSKLNLYELIKLFTSNELPEFNKNETNILCSDSDVEKWNEDQSEYYYKLPIMYNKFNKNDIKLDFNINLNDLTVNRKKKIKIIRKINNINNTTTFVFNIDKPYVIYKGGGDIDNDNIGNLIIKLNLPNMFEWKENLIIYNYPMNLYDMVYGMELDIDLGFKIIKIDSWTPSRDGYQINFDDINIKNNKLSIKFYLNYNHSKNKEMVLKKYFCD
jgi:curved DNA-binding protein CbpA